MDIKIRGVQKHYGSFHALRGIDVDIASGELLALLGPSGSGKTTLLRAIAGLEPIDDGQILFGDTDGESPRFARTTGGGTERPATDGRAASDRSEPSRQERQERHWIDATRIPVQQRRVGFVFQQYALFKHMSLFDNVAFGLTVRPKAERPDSATITRRVNELLELVQLAGLEKRYPAQLSGGQKQRVALARALAIEPRVLLLDEPFGALDAKVRKDLRRWLRRLHRETGTTMVFVTHDQDEALELADRVVVMNRGQIEQIGATDHVYDVPGTPFVFDFLGSPNVLKGVVRDGRVYLAGSGAPLDSYAGPLGGDVEIYARPADFRVVHSDPAGLGGRVIEVQRTGVLVRLGLLPDGGGGPIEIEIPNPDPEMQVWDVGDAIAVRPAHFSVFEAGANTVAPAPGFDSTKTVAETRSRARG